jgi:hypothetical protein
MLSRERGESVRHWAMELVVVVVGVLLALWAQEWAQNQSETKRTEAALVSIRAEARENLSLLMFKRSIDRCLIEREILLRDALLAPRDEWTPIKANALVNGQIDILRDVPMLGVFARQGDPMQTYAYRSAMTTGALSTLDSKRLEALSQLYANFDQINSEEEKGDKSIRSLAALSHPIRLTSDLRARLLGELYSADRSRFAIRYALNNDLSEIMKRIGWYDEAWFDDRIARDEQEQERNGIDWRPCKQKVVNPFRFKGN